MRVLLDRGKAGKAKLFQCRNYENAKELRLLHNALPVGAGDNNYCAVPYRMGIQWLPEGDKPFSRRFRVTMAMVGAVKAGSSLLVT